MKNKVKIRSWMLGCAACCMTVALGCAGILAGCQYHETDFATVLDSISTTFKSVDAFKVDAKHVISDEAYQEDASYPQTQIKVYVQNNGYLRIEDITAAESIEIINLKTLDNYIQKYDEFDEEYIIENSTVTSVYLEYMYQDISAYFDTSFTEVMIRMKNESRKVSVKNNKYEVKYTLMSNLTGFGYTEHYVTLISSLDYKIEKLEVQIGNIEKFTATYSYTGVPTVKWQTASDYE